MRTLLYSVLLAVAVPAAGQDTLPYEPRVLAHVCTWLSKAESWNVTATQPLRGRYDSTDPAVIASQLGEMRQAGMAPLISWWGPDIPEGDGYLRAFLSIKSDVPAAILYEGENRLRRHWTGWYDLGYPFNERRFLDDMRYLYRTFFQAAPERFFQQDGRFVVIVWPSHVMRSLANPGMQAMHEMPLYLVGTNLTLMPEFRENMPDVVPGLAAVSGYGLYLRPVAHELGTTLNQAWLNRLEERAQAWDEWLAVNQPQVRLVRPMQFMFDDQRKRGDENPPLQVDVEVARTLVQRTAEVMRDAERHASRYLSWSIFDSYNEHFEGTAIEPSDRYGWQVYDILQQQFGQYRQDMIVCPAY